MPCEITSILQKVTTNTPLEKTGPNRQSFGPEVLVYLTLWIQKCLSVASQAESQKGNKRIDESKRKMTKNDKKCYDNWELNKLGTGELQLLSLFLLHIGCLHLPRIPGKPPGWHDTCYLNLNLCHERAIASWKVATFQIIYLPVHVHISPFKRHQRWVDDFPATKKAFPETHGGSHVVIVSEWWVDFFEIRILSQNQGYTIHGTGIFTYI